MPSCSKIRSAADRAVSVRAGSVRLDKGASGLTLGDLRSAVRPQRVFIAAESSLVRSGLAAWLGASPELEVEMQGSAPDALLLAETEVTKEAAGAVDVLVWETSGVESGLAEQVRALSVATDCLLLVPPVAAAPGSGIAELLSAGARGVLYRDVTPERLRAAALAVRSGAIVLDDGMLGPLLEQPSSEPAQGELTPREGEVLGLMAEGLSNKLIAKTLGISEHTAKFHVNSLLEKLGAETRPEAVVRAARRGWLML